MLELNKIYNMDCIEGLKLLDDNSIDLIVTSPPYNVGVDYDTYKDCMPWDNYLDWCEEWLKECYRVLKDDGRICINHYIAFSPREYDESGNCINSHSCRFPLFDFRTIMEKIGYNVSKLAVWEDITMKKFTAWGSWLSASSPNILTPYEGILIAYKKQWAKASKGKSTIDKDLFMEGVSGVWNLGTVRGKTKACFPESLPNMCIQLLTYEGDTVLDPFMGSGTTAVVAKKTKRNFIGFELSKDYCNIANARLVGSEPKVVQRLEDGTVLAKSNLIEL